MTYFFLTPSDPLLPSYVLYTTDKDGRLTLRNEYRAFSCLQCGRVDEMKVVGKQTMIDDVKVQRRKDMCATGDWFLCVSERFRNIVEASGISGASFIPLVKSPKYSVLIANEVDTDIATCQMKFIGAPCMSCGRYRESIFRPALSSMVLPSDRSCLFMPRVRPEKGTGRICMLIASEAAAQALRDAKVSGIDWKSS